MFQTSILISIIVTIAVPITVNADPDFHQDLSQGVLFTKEAHLTLTDEKWTLAIDVNLSNYLNLAYQVNNQMQLLNLVSKDVTQVLSGYQMTFLKEESDMMASRINHITHTIQGIIDTTPTQRVKRGLANVGGSALKFLFGTPDDNDLTRIEAQFRDLNAVDTEIVHSLKAQASMLNRTYDMIKLNTNTLKEVHEATNFLQQTVRQLQDQIKRNREHTLQILDAHFTINSNFRMLGFVISSIEHDVNQLMLTLDKVSQGKLCNAIINPSKLKDTLAEIEDRLPNNYAFLHSVRFIDIHNFYSTSYAYATSFQDTIRILVEFPLTTLGRSFTLYRVNQFAYFNPKLNASVSIKSSLPLLAVANDGMSYYEMRDHELNKCQGTVWKICVPIRPISHLPIISCNMALFRGDSKITQKLCQRRISTVAKEAFYRADGDNRWAYSVSRPVKTITHCLNNNQTAKNYEIKTVQYLEHTGLLSLEKNCYAQAEGRTLLPHSEEITPISSSLERFHFPTQLTVDRNTSSTEAELDDEIPVLLREFQGPEFSSTDLEFEKLHTMVNNIHSIPVHPQHQQWTTAIITTTMVVAFLITTITLCCHIRILRRSRKWQEVNQDDDDDFSGYIDMNQVHRSSRVQKPKLFIAPTPTQPSPSPQLVQMIPLQQPPLEVQTVPPPPEENRQYYEEPRTEPYYIN